ncbi:hypothetical protein MHH28_03870 [Paenibacillus sp. FSL K6-1217]|uniref:hypothetical protein n=1 Tax=Paenibacillus sp. FSL K6-1217 TaxID=2921466 RepID=UPI0032542077
MYTLIAGAVLFLLVTAGIIAYQNSRILAEQETDASRTHTGNLMYSVYNQRFSADGELPEAVPLFQFTVYARGEEDLPESEAGTTRALCRVAAGTGELALSDAQNYMLGILRQAALQGGRLVPVSFSGKAARRGEKELIQALETAAKEEAGYADQR